MTIFLLTFLPYRYRAQYWFFDYNTSYFSLESVFVARDFIFICQYYSFASAINTLDETHAFLVRMDRKRVKWMIFLPDTSMTRQLFAAYRLYPLGRSRHGVPALVVTNVCG